MNKEAWSDIPRSGAPRLPSEHRRGCPTTSLDLHIISTKGRDATPKLVPESNPRKVAANKRPKTQRQQGLPQQPTSTPAMNLHGDEYWNDNIIQKSPSGQFHGQSTASSPSRDGRRSAQQSTPTDRLVWPEDAFATTTRPQDHDVWADRGQVTFQKRGDASSPPGKSRSEIMGLGLTLSKPPSTGVDKRAASQATNASSGASTRLMEGRRKAPVRSVSMDSIPTTASPVAPSRRVLVVPVHQRGSPMPSTPMRQKRRPVTSTGTKSQEVTWARFGADPPGNSAAADNAFVCDDIGIASETSRTATTVTATYASSSHATPSFYSASPRTPPRSSSMMSASRSPTSLSVPSLVTPKGPRSRIQRTNSQSRARVAAASPRRKSNGSSSSSSRRSSMGSNAFSISDKGEEDDDAVFSRISFENLGQYFMFPGDNEAPPSHDGGVHSPTPTARKSPMKQDRDRMVQNFAESSTKPGFARFDDPLFPEPSKSLSRQNSIEDLQGVSHNGVAPPPTGSSFRRPGTKRTNTPRRSAPRTFVVEPESAVAKPSLPGSGLAPPMPFPAGVAPTLISDPARIPYHRSLAKRLKDRQDDERVQLLLQIRSRSSLPTSAARPPTPPRQRRYGTTAAGAGASAGPAAAASPRRTAASSRPQVRGGGRRKQITTKPALDSNRSSKSSYLLEAAEPHGNRRPPHHPGRTSTDIFGDQVDQLNAFDDSFSELITWARFHK